MSTNTIPEHTGTPQHFDFDVTLSFAEEDRPFVARVARILKSKGLNLFYDKYALIDSWGLNLYEHLDDVYRNRARYCVIFISEHYRKKLWTEHERESAQARAFLKNETYILPFRMDATDLPGLKNTISYLTINEFDEKKLAAAIIKKVAQPVVPPTPAPQPIRPFIGLTVQKKIKRHLYYRIKWYALALVSGGAAVYGLADRLTPPDILARKLYERSRQVYDSARCNDGTWSLAKGRGACSHHGGVAYRIKDTFYSKTLEQCKEEAARISFFP